MDKPAGAMTSHLHRAEQPQKEVPPRKVSFTAGTIAAGGHHRQLAGQDKAVAACLREVGLQEYAVLLLQNGFNDLETLSAMTDAEMKDLGMAPSHIAWLRRWLLEIQGQAGSDEGGADGDHQVEQFLQDAGMGEHAQVLLTHGFSDMETLLDIEDSDLKDLGIPRGFAVKLRRRLREFQTQQLTQEGRQHLRWSVSTLREPPRRRVTPIPPAAMSAIPTQAMKTAVQRSWEKVEALGTYAIGDLLLRRTFELAPAAVRLFPQEVRTKYREWTPDEAAVDDRSVYESPALRKLFSKFINAVGCAVAGLHEPSRLVPMLLQLGARHLNYGVRPTHWDVLGKALDVTLQEILREDFTPEVRSAWSMTYRFMASIMIEGLKGAEKTEDPEGKVSKDVDRSVSQASTASGQSGQSSVPDPAASPVPAAAELDAAQAAGGAGGQRAAKAGFSATALRLLVCCCELG